MFSGIVTSTARIQKIEPLQNGRAQKMVFILSDSLSLSEGQSISVNGICLTVTSLKKNSFVADVSEETLEKTTAKTWKIGEEVNIEPSLKLSDSVGGHLVSGHVDGVGTIVGKKEGEFIQLDVSIPTPLTQYLIPKGSLTIDGVGLTVNEISDNKISLMLIPHTLHKTNLKNKKLGESVNVEVDMIGKYVYHFLKEKYDGQN